MRQQLATCQIFPLLQIYICRIHTTRNMCIALKDHVARVEATIEQGNNNY